MRLLLSFVRRHSWVRQLRPVPGQAVCEARPQGAWKRREARRPKRDVKQCTHIPRATAHSTHTPGYARHQVIATSRTDYNREAQGMGVTYFMDADDFVEEVRATVCVLPSVRARVSLTPGHVRVFRPCVHSNLTWSSCARASCHWRASCAPSRCSASGEAPSSRTCSA